MADLHFNQCSVNLISNASLTCRDCLFSPLRQEKRLSVSKTSNNNEINEKSDLCK